MLQPLDLLGGVFVLKVGDESLEFELLAQIFEIGIDPKEWPARESSVYTALQPLHCLVGFAQNGVNARNLIIGVVGVTEGTRGIQSPLHTL